jgi:hypothetical protein
MKREHEPPILRLEKAAGRFCDIAEPKRGCYRAGGERARRGAAKRGGAGMEMGVVRTAVVGDCWDGGR